MKSYHKDEEIFKVNRAVAIVAVVEVKLVENCDIVDARATNGVDLCVNQVK